jgi:hypothetical protein
MKTASLRWHKKPPANRTPGQIVNHYLVEKEIADRLKRADREERKKIYAGMYNELFAKVPDHPRLTGVRDPASLAAHNRKKLALVEPFVNRATVFVEFAPGDCTFAYLVCERAHQVVGVDISSQAAKSGAIPDNFTLHIYDGYRLDLADDFADVAFSDQFIEHLHPDDVDHHFRLAKAVLKLGGSYILRTPHAFHGPFDISEYFSDIPQGFHLKEWTYMELGERLRALGFFAWHGGMRRRGRYRELPFGLFTGTEKMIGWLPHRARALAARAFLPRHIYIRAVK